MTSIMAPAGLVNLQAPIPSPRSYSLLDAATLVVPTSNRWLGGAWVGGYPVGPAHTHDPCSEGTNRVKEMNDEMGDSQNYRFSVYMDAFCTAQGVGPDATWLTDRLKLAFQVYEQTEVEQTFATGGPGTLGPYLGDLNMETLSGPVGALRALELLETAIARNGTGIIHATPAITTAWAADSLVEHSRNQMTTVANNTPVVSGAGYIGAFPAGGSAPAADQEWAFASGPIEIYRDPEIMLIPENYAEALDRSVNDLRYIAERPYLFNWIGRQDSNDDHHTQAGILVDLVP